MSALALVPCTLRGARAFVEQHHRHHKAPQGGLFAVAAADGDEVVGVAIVGNPVSRMLHDGWTAEVTRCCTVGTRNACSMLYGAAWRAARALGYRKLVTYTLAEEGGASLRAAGWRVVGASEGGSWSRPSRPRVDEHPMQPKLRWETSAGAVPPPETPEVTCAPEPLRHVTDERWDELAAGIKTALVAAAREEDAT